MEPTSSTGANPFPDTARVLLGQDVTLPDGEDHDGLSPEEEERIALELEANYEEAVRVFEVRFAELPPIMKLRDLWKERKISESDPIWIIVEVMSLHDARSQLVLTQVMRIIKAGDELVRFMVQRVERTANKLHQLDKDVVAAQEKVIRSKAAIDTLSEQMASYAKLQPLLIREMIDTRKMMETSRLRAKLEIAGIGAGCVFLGMLFAKIFLH